MKDLKCGLKDCAYNKGYSCCAHGITIKSDTDCESYSPDSEKSSSLFEAADDFVQANYSVDTKVNCKADCIFNKDEVCRANGITVMSGENQDALCLTFIKET